MKTGEKIVCVRSHSARAVIKGQIYTIIGLMECPGCKKVMFDVGVIAHFMVWYCGGPRGGCGVEINPHGIWWLDAILFAPIAYNSATEELANKEIVEEKSDIPVKIPEKA